MNFKRQKKRESKEEGEEEDHLRYHPLGMYTTSEKWNKQIIETQSFDKKVYSIPRHTVPDCIHTRLFTSAGLCLLDVMMCFQRQHPASQHAVTSPPIPFLKPLFQTPTGPSHVGPESSKQTALLGGRTEHQSTDLETTARKNGNKCVLDLKTHPSRSLSRARDAWHVWVEVKTSFRLKSRAGFDKAWSVQEYKLWKVCQWKKELWMSKLFVMQCYWNDFIITPKIYSKLPKRW